eukprot:3940751-Rhodomonas_salina.2
MTCQGINAVDLGLVSTEAGNQLKQGGGGGIVQGLAVEEASTGQEDVANNVKEELATVLAMSTENEKLSESEGGESTSRVVNNGSSVVGWVVSGTEQGGMNNSMALGVQRNMEGQGDGDTAVTTAGGVEGLHGGEDQGREGIE